MGKFSAWTGRYRTSAATRMALVALIALNPLPLSAMERARDACENIFVQQTELDLFAPVPRLKNPTSENTLEAQEWFGKVKRLFGFGAKPTVQRKAEEAKTRLRTQLDALLIRREELIQNRVRSDETVEFRHQLHETVAQLLETNGFKIERNYYLGRPVLDIISGPMDQPIGKVLLRAQERFGLKFQVEAGVMDGTLGEYDPLRSMIRLGPEIAAAESGEVFTTLLHEIRHAYLRSLTVKRVLTPFQAMYGGNEPLLSRVGYSRTFSFDELSTFSKDFYLVRAGVKDVVPTRKQMTKDQKLAQMALDVVDMSVAIQKMTREAFELLEHSPGWVKFQVNPRNNLTFAEIPLDNGTLGVYLVHVTTNSPVWAKVDALRAQLEFMHRTAQEYESVFRDEIAMRTSDSQS